MNILFDSHKVRRVLLVTILFLTVMHFIGALLEHYYGRTFGLFLFDLDRERSIPTIYATVTLLLCATLLTMIALAERTFSRLHFFYWGGLSLVFSFLALDEGAAIHENFISPVRDSLNTDGFLYNAWIIPYGIAFIALGLFYARFLLQLPRKIKFGFIVAGALFVAGAIGFEAIGGYQATTGGTEGLQYGLITMVEETLEMVGIAIFITALLDYLTMKFGGVQLGTVRQPEPKKVRNPKKVATETVDVPGEVSKQIT